MRRGTRSFIYINCARSKPTKVSVGILAMARAAVLTVEEDKEQNVMELFRI